MQSKHLSSPVAFLVLGSAVALACGGSTPPAEQPESALEAPAAEAPAMPATDTPAESGHTMPDGTQMQGNEHGDGKSK